MVEPNTADTLLEIFRRTLGIAEIDLDGRFYALGGDSLLAIRAVNEARATGIPITLRDLLVHQSVRGVLSAPEVLRQLAAGAGEDPAAGAFELLDPGDRDLLPEGVAEALPASALQVGMLYLCEVSQDPRLYHTLEGWWVHAPFDERRFRVALAELCRRHPVLRTSFDFGGLSVPAQLVWARAELPLGVQRATGARAAETPIREWRESASGIDWRTPPLARCQVVALPDSFHVMLAAHHAILDGWSFTRLVVELMTIYHTGAAGLPAAGPGVPAAAIRAERAAAVSPAAAAHWLAQADVPPLLFGGGQPGVPSPRERHDLPLDAGLVAGMTGVARMLGVTAKSVALAAHVRALASWTGRERDVVTGLVFNTRPESPGSDLATGLFLNILPVRFGTVDGTWAGLIRAAADAERAGVPHQAFPQAALVERLGRPAFDVTFNFMNFHAYRDLPVPAGGWWRRGRPSFPFHVNVELGGEGGALRIGFDEAYLSRERVEKFAELFAHGLAALVANPVSPVGREVPA